MEYFSHFIYDFCGHFFLILLLYRFIKAQTKKVANGNKKMRIPIIILLLASLFAASSGKPPMPPSDEEMMRHFATHEAAFCKVHEIMAESSEGSFHYPPLSLTESLYLIQQSKAIHPMNQMTNKIFRYMDC